MSLLVVASLFLTLLVSPVEVLLSNEDPEIYWNATVIIRKNGYLAEEHFVTTEDGYILCLIRLRSSSLPDNKTRGVAFLQHGLLDSADTWIINNKDQSLGFMLADEGYDIWLGNSRGNTYSRKHIRYSSSSCTFWKFSWDDMAKYDLPASIYYILNVTNSEHVNYIGHSQGCQIALAQFSGDKKLESRVKLFIALAPVAYLGHMTSPLRYIAPLANVFQFFGVKEFLPSSKLMKFLAKVVCGPQPSSIICTSAIFLVAGYNQANMNKTRLPVYVAHAPAGTSSRNLVHYCQSIQSDRFQQYDHGHLWNWLIYGQSTPPEYDLSKIHLPIAVYNGGNDWLVTPEDIDRLLLAIQSNLISRVYLPDYNHLDFVWGMNAAQLVYPSVIRQLSEHNPL